MTCSIGRRVGARARQWGERRVRVRKVECTREIAAYGAPPRCDVRCLQAVLVAKTPLDESDDRCMVERLRAYPSPLRPRRYHEHRHARPKSVRPGRIALIPAEVLVDRIDGGRARRVRPRREWGRDMIKKAVVLIISDEKRRL